MAIEPRSAICSNSSSMQLDSFTTPRVCEKQRTEFQHWLRAPTLQHATCFCKVLSENSNVHNDMRSCLTKATANTNLSAIAATQYRTCMNIPMSPDCHEMRVLWIYHNLWAIQQKTRIRTITFKLGSAQQGNRQVWWKTLASTRSAHPCQKNIAALACCYRMTKIDTCTGHCMKLFS